MNEKPRFRYEYRDKPLWWFQSKTGLFAAYTIDSLYRLMVITGRIIDEKF